ncbi:MAG: glycosyltransferase family 4 protein [Bacilli bacterium]|nr:glycosyltransferase family 4 protein [Bacilli bacterium]
MKVGLIGNLGNGKKAFNGQTIKTREINNYLVKYFKVTSLDTSKYSKNIFRIFFAIKKLLKTNEVIIVMPANRGYQIITPIIMFLNKRYHRKLIEIVIGGSRYQLFDKHCYLKKLAKKYQTIYVETNLMKKEYLKRGFNNVWVLPNVKALKIGKYHSTKDQIKLCVCSRIIKEKGIEEAINAVIKANKALNKAVFSLDIYGDIKPSYEKKFNNILLNVPNYIKYQGKIAYQKASLVLNKYDLMLFLTYYPNEGFAGSIIDAFYAGIPVITTKWNSNEEIIKDGVNGLLVSIKNVDEVASKLIMLYNNKELIDAMKKNCLQEVANYQIDKVLSILVDDIKK